MGLLQDMQPYIDQSTGLIRAADGGGDNEPLFSSILVELLDDPKEKAEILGKLLSFTNRITVQIAPGFYVRSPGAPDNSVDNYIGLCSVPSVAWNILDAGRKAWWCFNVAKPYRFSLQYWFFRFIGFRPFVLMANNQPLYISQILYFLALMTSLLTGSTDVGNIQLQWLQNRRAWGKHWFSDLGIVIWRALALKRWPGGMQQIFSIYNGPNHPFVKWARNDFA